MLFVTIACGACSGFHGLVCSGTTSKQIDKERHTRAVGYGGMLLEGVVAVIALATVVMLPAAELPRGPDGVSPDANAIFATGIARFASTLGIPLELGLQFGFLALATFIYDTLDVCTRLGRYLLQELSAQILGKPIDRFTATGVTLAVPALLLFVGIDYQTAWRIFGASNQLLAALTLLGISIWLARRGRRPLFIMVPMLFLMTMTLWALGRGALSVANPTLLRVLSALLIAVALGILGLCLRPLIAPRPIGENGPGSAMLG
jgi:carbon starvation protein